MSKGTHKLSNSAKAAKIHSKTKSVKTKVKHLPDLSEFRSQFSGKGKPLSEIVIESRR